MLITELIVGLSSHGWEARLSEEGVLSRPSLAQPMSTGSMSLLHGIQMLLNSWNVVTDPIYKEAVKHRQAAVLTSRL